MRPRRIFTFIHIICNNHRYKCANYGDQGISVNCSDIYKHNIDCQWVDISELEPGEYVLKVRAGGAKVIVPIGMQT